MDNSFPRADDARRRRDFEMIKGLAIGLAFSLALTGSPLWGLMIGVLLLGIVAGSRGAPPTQQWRFIARNLGWLAASVALGYVAGDIVAHWPDFKRAVVDGWNAV